MFAAALMIGGASIAFAQTSGGTAASPSNQPGMSGNTGATGTGSPAMGQSGATGSPGTSAGTTGMTGAGQGSDIQTATGEVDKIDKDDKTLTLKDGKTYKLSDSASLDGINEGDRVTVTYREEDDDRRAMTVMEGAGSGSSGSTMSGSGGSGSGSSDK
jgi:Cu/Ag efflux protein CusF